MGENEFVSAPPPAAALAEALRGFGYAPGTAVADIVDNSIAARAGRVRVDFIWEGASSYVSIFDDGSGMDEMELDIAMLLGGKGPKTERRPDDLGRFGLGLKTASFSQCRCLTVASKKDGGDVQVRRWDLDYISRPEINDWRLLTSPAEGSEGRLTKLADVDQGTLVIWERLDRILDRLPRDPARAKSAFLQIAADVERHLSMIFHRYLDNVGANFRIYMNGDDEAKRTRPWDPFLSDHVATSSSPAEIIRTSSGSVELQGFVLPHRDRLDAVKHREAAGPDGWTAQQGFYVYRNKRLLLPGSWLGLGEARAWTKEESHQLARLRLDLPNSADHEWDIDVRKSIARPPEYLRPRLRDLATRIRSDARQVFAHRGRFGRAAAVPDLRQLWRSEERGNDVRYLIDREHPAVLHARENSNDPTALESFLQLIETTVPVRRIWLDTAERGEVQAAAFDRATEDAMKPVLRGIAKHLIDGCGFDPQDARKQLKATDPFHQAPELVDDIIDAFEKETNV